MANCKPQPQKIKKRYFTWLKMKGNFVTLLIV